MSIPRIALFGNVKFIEFISLILSFDKKATDEMFESMLDIFDGILKVEKKGIPGFWFAPWD
ncbi:MAG: hypothetical protein FJW63_09595, partial [Actinobacteria bacterium]|nr:hypothetical protein [Actinomycetota bacterium]